MYTLQNENNQNQEMLLCACRAVSNEKLCKFVLRLLHENRTTVVEIDFFLSPQQLLHNKN